MKSTPERSFHKFIRPFPISYAILIITSFSIISVNVFIPLLFYYDVEDFRHLPFEGSARTVLISIGNSYPELIGRMGKLEMRERIDSVCLQIIYASAITCIGCVLSFISNMCYYKFDRQFVEKISDRIQRSGLYLFFLLFLYGMFTLVIAVTIWSGGVYYDPLPFYRDSILMVTSSVLHVTLIGSVSCVQLFILYGKRKT